MNTKQFKVIVIGAGFGGISTSTALLQYGVGNALMLEAGENLGTFWKTNYDRITNFEGPKLYF